MIDSPVTGQCVSRRRRGDEITQQISMGVGQEARLASFHPSTFDRKYQRTAQLMAETGKR